MVCMCFFASIGTWLFGETRDDFSAFNVTMRTLFEMLFGEFPDGWGDAGIQLTLFTVFPDRSCEIPPKHGKLGKLGKFPIKWENLGNSA